MHCHRGQGCTGVGITIEDVLLKMAAVAMGEDLAKVDVPMSVGVTTEGRFFLRWTCRSAVRTFDTLDELVDVAKEELARFGNMGENTGTDGGDSFL